MVARRSHWSGFDGSGLSAGQRDDLVVRLRGEGLSMRAIARRVGMSVGGVHAVLERVADGRSGRDPRR